MSRTPAPGASPPELPGYRFIRHLGAGGNAQVYLYAQDLPKREVAVKVLNESALSEAARHRFVTEANVTAGLPHRHIVQVFDAKVTPDGRPYIVMPYYPQPNLSVRARRSHFSVADVLRIGIQIGSAVETTHRLGVLHRDIKPQNILTDSYGEPALTDFGIATTTGGDGPEGLSVPWSPPEILYGTAPGDQRSDVYSLGATLWHLLAGRSPFEVPGGDNTTYALMGRIKSDQVPRTQRADVPGSLERLLRQTMAKDPAARPQTAMELIRGLQSIEQELRLPVTHPILPADGPSAPDAAGDTMNRTVIRPGAGARDGDTMSSRGFGRDAGLPDTQTSGPGTWGPGHSYADTRTQAGPSAQSSWARTSESGWGSTSQPAWGGDTWDAASGPAARSGTWSPAGGEDIATRGRAPVRLDPWGTAGGADDGPTRTRGPVRLDPRGGVPARGAAAGAPSRQFSPEPATVARARRLASGDDGLSGTTEAGPFGRAGLAFGSTESPGGPVPAGTGTAERGKPGRALALAAGGVALAVAAGVAMLTLAHGGGGPAPVPTAGGQATQSGGPQNALGPGAIAPGVPAITARRASAREVLFRWTYSNRAPGDKFRWQVVSGAGAGTAGLADKPELRIAVARGHTVCVEVQVRRADGLASEQSQPACWP